MVDEAVENHECDGCGQLDNHPMIHVMGTWQKNERTSVVDPSFHFDCIPEEYENLLGNSPQHSVTIGTIAKARSGTHGDKLREFILKQPSDNEVDVPADESPEA